GAAGDRGGDAHGRGSEQGGGRDRVLHGPAGGPGGGEDARFGADRVGGGGERSGEPAFAPRRIRLPHHSGDRAGRVGAEGAVALHFRGEQIGAGVAEAGGEVRLGHGLDGRRGQGAVPGDLTPGDVARDPFVAAA